MPNSGVKLVETELTVVPGVTSLDGSCSIHNIESFSESKSLTKILKTTIVEDNHTTELIKINIKEEVSETTIVEDNHTTELTKINIKEKVSEKSETNEHQEKYFLWCCRRFC